MAIMKIETSGELTVKELMRILNCFNPDMVVRVTDDEKQWRDICLVESHEDREILSIEVQY
jgi:hypothetical protein